MITYINGSPKINNSASNNFLKDIYNKKDKINYIYKDKDEDIINNLKDSETIIISFPLYADSPTSGVLNFFEYIEDNNINLVDKNLYVIINCGFLESKQNNTAVEIVNCFFEKNDINFKGYFLIGGGPIVGNRTNIIYKLLTIPYYFKKNKFKNKINKNENIYLKTSLMIPKWLYVLCANKSWKKQIYQNKK